MITPSDCFCRLVGVAGCFDTFDCCISWSSCKHL